jgi:tetratricopeptide (TPR) repeat protein
VADIFVSYTASDRGWAFWIGRQLDKLGHKPHIHEWEIQGGGDIAAWMEECQDKADHTLCVISEAYLKQPYSNWERRAAEWAANSGRPNFVLPVFVEDCKPPTLLASYKRCDLWGVTEDEARGRLAAFLVPPKKPEGDVSFPGAAPAKRAPPKPEGDVPFPSMAPAQRTPARPASISFPGAGAALSNIPVRVPVYFIGRDGALAAIAESLSRRAVTVVHGLRGVGKTVLAAAYAENNRASYRAIWWLRAHTESTLRADLAALGARLNWVGEDIKEEESLAVVLGHLRSEGEGILLIYDSAVDADSLEPYLPRSGAAKALVTSNAHAWRSVGAPIELTVWPKEIGAAYFIERTGRTGERAAAEALSEALGGLPLAHEQAAAYCEGLDISLAEYLKRFKAGAEKFLDDKEYAPEEYHPEYREEHGERLTVAGTFRLAIGEAAHRHSAAKTLIKYAALLAPEPVPLFLFSEGRETFAKSFASALAGDGLDEVVAALLHFALADRETIADERDPSITTDCIRLHRLVREVAAARVRAEERNGMLRELTDAMAAVYPRDVFNDPGGWPRARRLDALALPLAGGGGAPEPSIAETAALLLNRLGSYRHGALAAYAEARRLFEQAVATYEQVLGREHPSTAASLNNLASLLQDQGDFEGARPLFERALAIYEKALGPDHPVTATTLNNLAFVLKSLGHYSEARPLYERALTIRRKALGADHPDTATSLNNLAGLLYAQEDYALARRLYERALALSEKALGAEHPATATCLNNLGNLLYARGEYENARSLFERALAIRERVLGAEHPNTKLSASLATVVLEAQGRAEEAAALRARFNLPQESQPPA